MNRADDLARENTIMRAALRQISSSRVGGRPTLSAGVAIGALRQVDKLPPPDLVPERGVSFIRLP